MTWRGVGFGGSLDWDRELTHWSGKRVALQTCWIEVAVGVVSDEEWSWGWREAEERERREMKKKRLADMVMVI
jgi:hypothetical protein